MNSGFLVYKCRKCGRLNKDTHVPNGTIALSCIVCDFDFPKDWGALKPGMTGVCNCSNGDLGITDLIGFEPEKEEES
jgi:hypothetical protein